MFDRVEITVKAGDGGDGVVSFRREKYVPYGGPDGGDGGDGGAVILRADAGVSSLLMFKHRRTYRAKAGEDGQGSKKHGRKGEDLILPVPVGTVVVNKAQFGEGWLIGGLEQAGQQLMVARGGKGGLGNAHFASSTNQAPQIAQRGEPGEEKSLILELRIIADVGIIGYPNAGKSTLLSGASAARPKIADYPFTTIEPVLGAVEAGEQQLVLVEIPGLIDGAHLGRGLGHDFLRHVTRTKVILHLIDGTSASPVEDMLKVNKELSLFDSSLAQKPQLVAINKIDLPEVRARLAEIEDALAYSGIKADYISAATGEGVPALMDKVSLVVKSVTSREKSAPSISKAVFRPPPIDAKASVRKEGDTFVVVAPELERLVAGSDISSLAVRGQLRQWLSRMGLNKALAKAGIKAGDKVRCGDLEWEW